jgi:transposase
MAKPKGIDPKEKALRDHGALNTHPVHDELFVGSEFFDPRDLVQVKYEMLRKVHKEGKSIRGAADGFGFSRPSFYKTKTDFEREGVAGLLPRKRGPKGGHKLTTEVLDFVDEITAQGEQPGISALMGRIEEHFGLRVHRRTVERALGRRGKKTP